MGPGLSVQQKWHVPARNVAVGDLVWLADQNTLTGWFRLGQVTEACPVMKDVARDVRVRTCQSCPAFGGLSKRSRGAENCPFTILYGDCYGPV